MSRIFSEDEAQELARKIEGEGARYVRAVQGGVQFNVRDGTARPYYVVLFELGDRLYMAESTEEYRACLADSRLLRCPVCNARELPPETLTCPECGHDFSVVYVI
jgi:hypothetical protein